MVIKLPKSKRSSASAPKAGGRGPRKPARLRQFLDERGVQHGTPHCTPQFAAILRDPGAPGRASGADLGPPAAALGTPLWLPEVACLIGCSPWSVRQTLIPRGLPHFRFTANGRLIFYRDQVIRWIESQQKGGE